MTRPRLRPHHHWVHLNAQPRLDLSARTTYITPRDIADDDHVDVVRRWTWLACVSSRPRSELERVFRCLRVGPMPRRGDPGRPRSGRGSIGAPGPKGRSQSAATSVFRPRARFTTRPCSARRDTSWLAVAWETLACGASCPIDHSCSVPVKSTASNRSCWSDRNDGASARADRLTFPMTSPRMAMCHSWPPTDRGDPATTDDTKDPAGGRRPGPSGLGIGVRSVSPGRRRGRCLPRCGRRRRCRWWSCPSPGRCRRSSASSRWPPSRPRPWPTNRG